MWLLRYIAVIQNLLLHRVIDCILPSGKPCINIPYKPCDCIDLIRDVIIFVAILMYIIFILIKENKSMDGIPTKIVLYIIMMVNVHVVIAINI